MTVTSDPSGAIIRSWEALYEELLGFARMAEVLPIDLKRKSPQPSARTLADALRHDLQLDREDMQLIADLSDLRNEVAHGRHEPTSGEAHTYELSADKLRKYIVKARQSFQRYPSSDGSDDRDAQ